VTTEPVRIYPALFGAVWPTLPNELRSFFGSFGRWTGSFDVRRGNGFFGRLIGNLIRLPRAGSALPTTLEVEPLEQGERWRRTFGPCPLATSQRIAAPALVAERVGCIEFLLRISAAGQAVVFDQVAAAVALGTLRLPLPRFIAPHVTGRTWFDGDKIAVRVSMTGPARVPLIEYEGSIACK
jgi:hypothetical protein